MTKVALAFDLGGTELRAALVDDEGRVLSSLSAQTLAREGPDAVIGQIEEMAATLRNTMPDVLPVGIGIGAPGPLEPRAGIVINAPTLSGWQNVAITAILEERLGLPTHLENDANAAALGEWRFGAGRGASSLIFVTVSTGIGGGVIVDGMLLHGRRGLAGEIGHMTITSEGEPCFCGAIGCFEAVASGTALGRRGESMTKPFDGSRIRLLSGEGAVTGRHVIEAARTGDQTALRLVEDEAHWLGIGFTNLLHLFSPDMIVMGGGIAHGFDLLKGTIEATIRQRAMPAYRDVPIVHAALGRHAGLVGAASLVFQDGTSIAPNDKKAAQAVGLQEETSHG
jgi:glucokinase